jgi:hypothetical protein
MLQSMFVVAVTESANNLAIQADPLPSYRCVRVLFSAGAPVLEDQQQAMEAAGLSGSMLVLKWLD